MLMSLVEEDAVGCICTIFKLQGAVTLIQQGYSRLHVATIYECDKDL